MNMTLSELQCLPWIAKHHPGVLSEDVLADALGKSLTIEGDADESEEVRLRVSNAMVISSFVHALYLSYLSIYLRQKRRKQRAGIREQLLSRQRLFMILR